MINAKSNKVGCVFPMAISSDFRMEKHRDDEHEEKAPYFTKFEIINQLKFVLFLFLIFIRFTGLKLQAVFFIKPRVSP